MGELQIEQKKKSKIRYIDEEWEKRLICNNQGNICKTIDNFYIILENSERFRGKIKFNELSEKIEYDGKDISDIDYALMQREIEKQYGIFDEKKFINALRLVSEQHKYNSIKDMLEGLKWDGIRRADTILSKYLGAEENEYTAMCFRLLMFGAIERIYNPGAKFDYMLILKGGQGLGKSTFFSIVCGQQYYQENLEDLKKAFEYTQGKWIVEIGELQALKKSEIDAIKTFITTRKQTHRFPYDKTSRDFYRKFVLIGTTNDNSFLADETGSRRFIILECAKKKADLKHNVFEENAEYEIKQALAEVFQEYKEGKGYFVVPEKFEKMIEETNKNYLMDDGLTGLVEDFLEYKDRCCILQIWDECIEEQKKWKYSKTIATRIRDIILKMPDWQRYAGSKDGKTTITSNYVDKFGNARTKQYGKQVVFERIRKPEKNTFKENSNEMMNKIYKTENEDYFMEV